MELLNPKDEDNFPGEGDTNNNASGSISFRDLVQIESPIPHTHELDNMFDTNNKSASSLIIEDSLAACSEQYIKVIDQDFTIKQQPSYESTIHRVENIISEITADSVDSNTTIPEEQEKKNEPTTTDDSTVGKLILNNYQKILKNLQDLKGRPDWEGEFNRDVHQHQMDFLSEILSLVEKKVPTYNHLDMIKSCVPEEHECGHSSESINASYTAGLGCIGSYRRTDNIEQNYEEIGTLSTPENFSLYAASTNDQNWEHIEPTECTDESGCAYYTSQVYSHHDVIKPKLVYPQLSPLKVKSKEKNTSIVYNNPFDPRLPFKYLKYLSYSPKPEVRSYAKENLFMWATKETIALLELYLEKYRLFLIQLGVTPILQLKVAVQDGEKQGIYEASNTLIKPDSPTIWLPDEDYTFLTGLVGSNTKSRVLQYMKTASTNQNTVTDNEKKSPPTTNITGQLTDTSAKSGHGHGVKRKLWDDNYHNMKNIENISALNKNELGVNVLPPKRCASEADIVPDQTVTESIKTMKTIQQPEFDAAKHSEDDATSLLKVSDSIEALRKLQKQFSEKDPIPSTTSTIKVEKPFKKLDNTTKQTNIRRKNKGPKLLGQDVHSSSKNSHQLTSSIGGSSKPGQELITMLSLNSPDYKTESVFNKETTQNSVTLPNVNKLGTVSSAVSELDAGQKDYHDTKRSGISANAPEFFPGFYTSDDFKGNYSVDSKTNSVKHEKLKSLRQNSKSEQLIHSKTNKYCVVEKDVDTDNIFLKSVQQSKAETKTSPQIHKSFNDKVKASKKEMYFHDHAVKLENLTRKDDAYSKALQVDVINSTSNWPMVNNKPNPSVTPTPSTLCPPIGTIPDMNYFLSQYHTSNQLSTQIPSIWQTQPPQQHQNVGESNPVFFPPFQRTNVWPTTPFSNIHLNQLRTAQAHLFNTSVNVQHQTIPRANFAIPYQCVPHFPPPSTATQVQNSIINNNPCNNFGVHRMMQAPNIAVTSQHVLPIAQPIQPLLALQNNQVINNMQHRQY